MNDRTDPDDGNDPTEPTDAESVVRVLLRNTPVDVDTRRREEAISAALGVARGSAPSRPTWNRRVLSTRVLAAAAAVLVVVVAGLAVRLAAQGDSNTTVDAAYSESSEKSAGSADAEASALDHPEDQRTSAGSGQPDSQGPTGVVDLGDFDDLESLRSSASRLDDVGATGATSDANGPTSPDDPTGHTPLNSERPGAGCGQVIGLMNAELLGLAHLDGRDVLVVRSVGGPAGSNVRVLGADDCLVIGP